MHYSTLGFCYTVIAWIEAKHPLRGFTTVLHTERHHGWCHMKLALIKATYCDGIGVSWATVRASTYRMLRLGSDPRLLPLQSRGFDRAGTYKHDHEQMMAHVSSDWMWHGSLVEWWPWRFCNPAPSSVIRHVGLVGFRSFEITGVKIMHVIPGDLASQSRDIGR